MCNSRTSEWVSIGHPDKMADFISEFILDKYISFDKNVRYAVETQIKDNHVSLAGEISSSVSFSEERLASFVKDAIDIVGYTKEYAVEWNGQCTDSSEIKCDCYIGQQSPDIAVGVNHGGWGDQGIFWGMAVSNKQTKYMPIDIYLAREIGIALYKSRIGGIDIKTQVTLDENEKVSQIVIAIPTKEMTRIDEIKDMALSICEPYLDKDAKVIINGTGSYITHGSVGDCGTTGRKLVVDFYGGNCEIGGGSPWTKDGTKSDLTLNLYARKLSIDKAIETGKSIKTLIECCIGSPEIGIKVYDWETNKLIDFYKESKSPKELVEEFGLDMPVFSKMCLEGLPYWVLKNCF